MRGNPERLYKTTDHKWINFPEYIRTLVDQLMSSYQVEDHRIKYSIDMPEIVFDVNIVIPLGLIVNELVSNALKHAFPDGADGELRLAMNTRDDECILSVKDNGIGFPADLDIYDTETLGMIIVSSLVKQIKGQVETISKGGTEFLITFREEGLSKDT